jgi:hypothetical protein
MLSIHFFSVVNSTNSKGVKLSRDFQEKVFKPWLAFNQSQIIPLLNFL